MPSSDARFQPTLVFDSNEAQVTQFVTDLSDASLIGVGLVAAGQPRFAEETAGLLKTRLSAASLLLAVILGLGFPVTFAADEIVFIFVRSLVLVTLTSCYFVLRWRPKLSLRALRRVEVLIFGISAFQIALIAHHTVLDAIYRNDAADAVAAKNSFLGIWSVFILTYGLFMPNTWRRAAVVMITAALSPHVFIWWASYLFPIAKEAFHDDTPVTLIPMPLMAAAVGIYGSHVINVIRREAFQARQFGQYRLTAKLGSGGMGEVYQAEHRLLKRPCAIKVIRADEAGDEAALARFEREVQATAALSHWNTVEIFDYGRTDDGTFYYVMEYLPGLTLEELVVRHGPMPPARAVHFLKQVCGAVREAHSRGLVHRDIKPSNIFAAERGGVFDVAKLLDFGLVKDASATESASAKTDRRVAGSPLYMAPEQARSYAATDKHTDIYALGGVAYYLLTGGPPFSGDTHGEVLRAHAQSPVEPPSQRAPGIPSDLEQVVLRCLAKDPRERFADIEQLLSALQQCSCAHQWTDADASAWWQKVAPAADRGPPPTA